MFIYTSLCSPVFGHSCGLGMLFTSIAMHGFLPVVSGWEEGCGRLSRLLGHVHHVPDAPRDMRLADSRFVLVTRSPDSRVVRSANPGLRILFGLGLCCVDRLRQGA